MRCPSSLTSRAAVRISTCNIKPMHMLKLCLVGNLKISELDRQLGMRKFQLPIESYDLLSPHPLPSATVECKLGLVQLGSVLDEFGVRQCAVNGSSEILASDWPSQFDFD